ncbi:hypothetical protein SAMN04487897_12118 [Paenibacillus sp. yr247]|nr:hypothetical protein SAMN04487897_12118 [Paenibacillus sp. yr247]
MAKMIIMYEEPRDKEGFDKHQEKAADSNETAAFSAIDRG